MKVFLCGQSRTHTEHKLQFAVTLVDFLARQVEREAIAVEVEARERVRVSPTQTARQVEFSEDHLTKTDELLDLCISRAGVRRPAEGCDNLVGVDVDEIVPELNAIAIIVLRDGEETRGSVEVECGVFVVHD